MSSVPEQTNLQLHSPGELLKEEREKRQMSPEDIARQLNLKIDIIYALESDQYEKLAAPTYTRGYLRSYAKAVEIDAESLIQLFDNTQNNSNSPEILPKVSKHTQVSSSDKPVKIVTYLLTLGTVLLVLVWWKGDAVLGPGGENMEETAGIVQPPVKSAFDYEYTIIHHPTDPHYRANISADDYQETPIASADDVESELLDVSTDLPIDTNINPNNIAIANENETGSDLTLLIEKESWIEIYDVNNKRLYLDLAKPGKIITVSGPTPYSLLLGNAHGVRLQFQGKEYDLKPHIRQGVARLKLGE